MSHFFISYKREDEEFVDELDAKLSENDILTWRDRKIKPGEEWKKAIDNAIDNCIAVLLVISPEALTSHYVTYEWAYAMGARKLVIPIIHETVPQEGMHPKLPDRQYSLVSDGDKQWDELIHYLVELMKDNIIFPSAVEEALKALDSPNPSEREQGINSLKDNQNSLATDALWTVVNHDFLDVQIQASLAIASRTNYEEYNIISHIEKGLQYEDNYHHQRLQENSFSALSKFDNLQSAEILLDLLYTRKTGIYGHQALIASPYDEINSSIINHIKILFPETIALNDSNRPILEQSLEILTGRQAIEQLGELKSWFRGDFLNPNDTDMRQKFLTAIEKTSDDDVSLKEFCYSLFENEANYSIKTRYIQIIGRIGDEDDVVILQNLTRNTEINLRNTITQSIHAIDKRLKG